MADHDSYRAITVEQRLTLPLNGFIYTTTRQVPAEKVAPKLGETMQSELGSAWNDSIVIASSHVPDSAKRQLSITHARIPSVDEQLASNWEWSEVSTSIGALKGVSRTFIYLTSAFSETSPALASAMPIYSGSTVPAGAVTGQFTAEDGYILFSRDVTSSGTQLEPVFGVERRTYIKRKIVRSIGVDSTNGKPLYATSELRHRDEIYNAPTTYGDLMNDPANAYWGLQADGTQRTARPATDEWIEITTEQVVSGTFSGGVVSVQSFNTTQNYYWPPVLKDLGGSAGYIEFMDWDRRDGGVDIYPRFVFDRAGYNGPCKAVITRTWSKSPQAVNPPKQMLPTPIHYASPYFSLNVPECLHGEVTCKCDIGNADPVYDQNVGSARTTPRTNYLDWPSTIIASDDQDPYRGGYLRTTVTIYQPDNTAV